MRKIFWVALCWLASVTWAHAAPQVLFLSPDESKPVGRPVSQADWTFTNNAYNAFSAQVGAANIHDGRRVLDSATPDLSLFNGVQLVVITTTYAVISPEWRTELNTLMLNRPDLTFVFYPDGCCNDATNLQPILDTINTGTNWGVTRSGANIPGAVTSRLNTNSLYQGSFSTLQTMVGGDYQLVNSVPPDNALYTIRSASAPPPAIPGPRVNAYGFFVAQQSFNQGQGSCIFLTADISPFQNAQATQHAAIASSFVHAATDPAGACKQATREPDLTVALSGPGTLDLGATGNFSMAIANQGASDSSNGVVSMPLPAGFTVSGFPTSQPPGACSVAAGALTCNLGVLVATTGTTTIAFQGMAQQPGPISLTASITGVTGETNTSNNSATQVVQVPAPDLRVDWLPASTGELLVNRPFTVTVTNVGAGASLDGTLSIALPAELTVEPASLPTGCTLAGSSLTCTLSGLSTGTASSFTFQAAPNQPGTLNLSASVSAVTAESNTSNNSAPLSIQVPAPDLTVSWGSSASTGTPWVSQGLVAHVHNVGAGASHGGTLTLTLPSQLTVDPASLPAGCTLSGSSLTCTLAPLAAGASIGVAFQAKPTLVGRFDLTAAIAGVPYESQLGNNNATLPIEITAQPLLTPVPTLGQWGLLLLAAALAGVTGLRRRLG